MQNVILVVEDDPAVLEGISISLMQAGYLTVTAGNGAEGLEQLKEVKPDLILSDIMMPTMDGYEFYKALRTDPSWQLIPFVFITAKGQPHEIRVGKQLGVDDYLVKPFEVDDILVTVEARLQRARTINDANQQEFQLLKERITKLLNLELRTPLTHINGYSEMIAENADHIDQQALTEFLNSIRKGSSQLTRFMDDLLLLVAIEGGNAREQFDQDKSLLESPQELVEDVAATFETAAIGKGIILHVETSPLPPVQAKTDYLSIALNRLIINAIKATPGGGRIEINAYTKDNTLFIAVSDQGDGIPHDERPFIFDVFGMVDNEHYEELGSSLGLTIARELVGLHGGWITADNGQNGVGSTFSIMLPVVELIDS